MILQVVIQEHMAEGVLDGVEWSRLSSSIPDIRTCFISFTVYRKPGKPVFMEEAAASSQDLRDMVDWI